MTAADRLRLTALVAASTKLDAAAHLAEEAGLDLSGLGDLPGPSAAFDTLKIVDEIHQLHRRLLSAITRIPAP